MNSRFLNEAKELEARWLKSGLLDSIADQHTRQVTAVMLEGQRLMNEVAKPARTGNYWLDLDCEKQPN